MSHQYGYTLCIRPQPDPQGNVKVKVYWWPLQSDDAMLSYFRAHPDLHPVEPVPNRTTGPLVIRRGTCTHRILEEFKTPDYWKDKTFTQRGPVVIESQLVSSEAVPCKPCAEMYLSEAVAKEWQPLTFHLLLARLNGLECHHRVSEIARK